MKQDKLMTGIYGILCLVTWKWYIGHSTSITERWWDHRKTLRKGTSSCTKLQHAWNKHGEPNFEFRILYECPENELSFWEDFFVECFNSIHDGYNIIQPSTGSRRLPFKLKSLLTGEIVNFDSTRSAASKLGIRESVLSGIRNGKLLRSKGWGLPSLENETAKLINPKGDVVDIFDLQTI